MNISGNTILITGGTSGIGLSLATRLLQEGNEVLICGRNPTRLSKCKNEHPDLHLYSSDISNKDERQRLYDKVINDFPNLNVLVNNAGISQQIDLMHPCLWGDISNEISINLEAPIHLSTLFSQHLSSRKNAVVIVTTSGLAHIPRANFPVYCSTKAALHSFTLSMRQQFKNYGIKVIEICPPHVNTDLGGADIDNSAGIDLNEYIDSVMENLRKGCLEITYGTSVLAANSTPAEREKIFNILNEKI